jgi:hypothetical protein
MGAVPAYDYESVGVQKAPIGDLAGTNVDGIVLMSGDVVPFTDIARGHGRPYRRAVSSNVEVTKAAAMTA